MDAAVTALKRASGASRLRLVGYSGGGVMAMLLAARRDDVAQVVTIAAPLRLAAHGQRVTA
jgi:esterase/lipase